MPICVYGFLQRGKTTVASKPVKNLDRTRGQVGEQSVRILLKNWYKKQLFFSTVAYEKKVVLGMSLFLLACIRLNINSKLESLTDESNDVVFWMIEL